MGRTLNHGCVYWSPDHPHFVSVVLHGRAYTFNLADAVASFGPEALNEDDSLMIEVEEENIRKNGSAPLTGRSPTRSGGSTV